MCVWCGVGGRVKGLYVARRVRKFSTSWRENGRIAGKGQCGHYRSRGTHLALRDVGLDAQGEGEVTACVGHRLCR